MLNKTFPIGTSTFATGSWHTVPRLPKSSAPRVSFELLRLHVMDLSNSLHCGQTSGRGASRGCWPQAKGRHSPSYRGLAPWPLGHSPPALPLPAGKGDGLPCCPTEGFAGHYVASKLSKCSNSGRLPRGISQPRRDLQTLAGSGIILVLMTQA